MPGKTKTKQTNKKPQETNIQFGVQGKGKHEQGIDISLVLVGRRWSRLDGCFTDAKQHLEVKVFFLPFGVVLEFERRASCL
jgi:hypothetical protein